MKTKLAKPIAAAAAIGVAALLSACSGEPVDNSEFVEEAEPEILADAIEDDAVTPVNAELSASGFELLLPVVDGRPAVLYGNVIAGAEPDALTEVRIEGARVEIHTTEETEDGAMTMTQRDTLPVEAGGTLTLQQGGNHGMVFDAPAEFSERSSVPVTLVFANAGERVVDARVDTRIGGVMAEGDEMDGMDGMEGGGESGE